MNLKKIDDSEDGGIISKYINNQEENVEDLKRQFGERYQKFLPPIHSVSNVSKPSFEPRDSNKFYEMRTTFYRGKMIIINIQIFEECNGAKNDQRSGTEKDVNALKKLFVDFGFVVEIFENLNTEELIEVMTKVSKSSFENFSCLFVAFLSHGMEKFIDATNGSVEIRRITSLFTGKDLAGKPKVFLIQACQGDKYMGTIDETEAPSKTDDDYHSISLPTEDDFLYAYSTPAGFYSWRNPKSGSWFIQTLCEVFQKHADTKDVIRMLTTVNNVISERASKSSDPIANGKKQVGSYVSHLSKEFYLFPPKQLHCSSKH